MADFPGPFSPEELALAQGYYGVPGVNMSDAGAPAPMPAATPAAPPPPDPASYYGPPVAVTMPATLPPEDPAAIVSPMSSQAPAAPMSTPPKGPPREPQSFVREEPGVQPFGPPVAPQGFATSNYAKSMPRGGGGSPDPFGVKGATRDYLGTFDDEKGALRRQAIAEGDRANMMSEQEQILAQAKADDAVVMRLEREEANRIFGESMREQERQLAEVREKKIDPDRLMREDGMQFKALVGGLLGGLYMGMTKGQSNPFMDQLNRQIDRDIGAQEKNIANERAAVADRMNMLKEQRAIFRDNETANLQARNLYYEAIKEHIAGMSAQYDEPIVHARADQGIAQVDRAQKDIQRQLAEREQQRAASAAAAAINARKQAEREEREYRLKLAELGIKEREVNIKAGEKDNDLPGRFVATGKDEQGNPIGYLDRSPADAAKAEDARRAREELRASINNILAIRSNEGALGRTINRADPKDPIQIYTPEWQTKVRQAKQELVLAKNKAAAAGTLDAASMKLYDDIIGDLETRGGEADVRLRGLLEGLDRSERVGADTSGGQTGALVIRNGKQVFVPSGGQHAPNSPRTVKRMPVE